MNTYPTTTRTQLRGYGVSQYHARILTQHLNPVAREHQTYIYALNDVIFSLRKYLHRPRLKPQTYQRLATVLQLLLGRLGNVIEVPFIASQDTELGTLAQQLMQAMSKTDRTLAELEATAATVKAKYQKF